MLKRFSTLVLVIALVCTLAGNSALATTLSEGTTRANVAATPTEPLIPETSRARV